MRHNVCRLYSYRLQIWWLWGSFGKIFLCLQLINDVKIKFILSSLIRGNSSYFSDLMENVDWIFFFWFSWLTLCLVMGILVLLEAFCIFVNSFYMKSFDLFFVNLNSVFDFLTFFLRKLDLVRFFWQLCWGYYRVRNVAV